MSDDSYEIYAIKYATHQRGSSDNFIGGDTHDVPMPIDYLFRSLGEEVGNRAMGVILSGTGSDGSLGLKAIKAEAGITFAQEEKTAKYEGMPRSAVAAGCVDFVLPPAGIARELSKRACRPRGVRACGRRSKCNGYCGQPTGRPRSIEGARIYGCRATNRKITLTQILSHMQTFV